MRINKASLVTIAIVGLFFLSLYATPSTVLAQPGKSRLYQAPTEILLGGLFPLTGGLAGGGVEREAAFRLAIEEINANDSLLPDTTLTYIVKDTQTDPAVGAQVAQEVIDAGAVGIVGAASSSVSKSVAGVAAQNQIPQISYSSTNPDLSDKDQYPYFLRVVPPDSVQGVALANIVKDFGFTEVATIATSDDYGQGGISVFEEEARNLGIKILSSQKFEQNAADVKIQLGAIKDSQAHVIVINAIVQDAITVFSQAPDVGLTGADYVWIGTDGPTQEAVFEKSDKVKEAMQGMVGTRPNTGYGSVYEHFLDLWESADPNQYAGAGDRTPNTYATFAYDAVYTFAYAFQKMINDGKDVTDGPTLLKYLYDTDFVGATGPVAFNDNGDREGVYDIVNLQGDKFVVVGSWNKKDGMQLTGTITWPGGSTETPEFGVAEGGGLAFELPIFLISGFAMLVIWRKKK